MHNRYYRRQTKTMQIIPHLQNMKTKDNVDNSKVADNNSILNEL